MGEIRGRNLAIVPEQLYAQVTAEVADLAEVVARVALHVEINSVIANAAEVNRAAEALRTAIGRRGDFAGAGAALAQPRDASCREENAIAARVLELHDRLGGFIMH